MRRAMLLTLVAVALPTAALANTIDFATGTIDVTTGRFQHGTVTRNPSGSFTMPDFSVTVTGTLGTIMLSTTSLGFGCNTNATGTCMFSTGSVKIQMSGGPVFMDTVSSGMIIKTSNGATITAMLNKNPQDPTGGVVSYTLSFAPGPAATNKLVGGTAFAASNQVIPEPSALLLLGTGVIGLAGIMRRKLKHDTRVRRS